MSFESWELPARLALGERGIGHHAANPIIEDVRAHCAYTGESPYDAFGDPAEFATATAAEQPPELLEKVDREGMTPAGHITGQTFVLALVSIPGVALVAIADRTWTFPATVAGLTGMALLIVALHLVQGVPHALRASGYPHLAKYSYAATGFLGLGAALAFTMLPREHLFPMPILALIAAALMILWLLTRNGRPPAEQPRPAPPADPDAWLTRLTGLLIGRYDLTPERAGELAREARAHLAESGRSPEEEFGPLEDYALKISEHEPVRRIPFHRTERAQTLGTLFALLAGGSAFVRWVGDDPWWFAWLIALPVALVSLWQLLRRFAR